MQTTDKVRKSVSHKRGKLPALLAIGVLFVFVLSACQVAVADDGTVHISPESTTGNTDGQNGADNILAGLLTQTGEVDPTTATAPIDPNRVYEWNGLVRFDDAAGGHFVIDRGCDRWAVIPANDEVYGKLKELHEGRATVWGTVNFDKSSAERLGRRTINATSAFAPGEVRPLIAVPEIPCPNTPPVPGDHIALAHSEVTLHGDLVWRGGRLWLVTPRGNVLLQLPRLATDMFPKLTDAAEANGADSELSISLGEYGVVGKWSLVSTGLAVQVRDIKEWPNRTFVRDHCGGGFHHFVVGDEQMAAHGTLIITDGQWLLRTNSGVIFVHRNANNAEGLTETDIAEITAADGTDPATGAVAPDVLRRHDVVVIGEWKTDGRQLHMEGDRFVRVKTNCQPPPPPRQPILPGEIAALGTLVFENGRPFLNTPSGRIVLLTRRNGTNDEPQPADPSLFSDVAPGATAAGDVVIGEDGSVLVDPDVARPRRHILVVGKWLLYREHLAIVVRYALPWPYPQPHPVDPMPLPMPPVPQPQPVPPVQGFPVEPVQPSGFGIVEPAFSGDSVTVEPESRDTTDRPAQKPAPSNTQTDGIAVGTFSNTAVK